MVPRDTRWLVRYGFTGVFAVAVVAISLTVVSEISVRSGLVVPVLAAASVVGFTLDAISAYKVHPAYTRLRRPFFVALARCEHPLDISGGARAIPEGESARETTIYKLDNARRVDLGIEHAVWIAAFHMHIILAGSAALLALAALSNLAVGLPQIRSGGAAALAVIYAGLAVASLLAATARLRSYNDKILDLTRRRTLSAHQGTLRSAMAAITDGWSEPGLGTEAFRLCEAAHRSQTRDDGEPYVFHPVRVALTLRFELAVDQPESLVLAILHDVFEAPVASRPASSQVAGTFGPELAEECELLAAKHGMTRAERDASYAASMESASSRVKLVKLADRIDNVRSLSSNPDRAKPARYLRETERHYLSLAAMTDPMALTTLEDAIANARSALGLRLGGTSGNEL